MLKPKIVGSEYKKIRFHGNVKHVVFECNTCHERFSKMESYVKKQMKRRQTACCFCSPRCRSIYFTGKLFAKDTQKSSLGNFLTKVFGGKTSH